MTYSDVIRKRLEYLIDQRGITVNRLATLSGIMTRGLFIVKYRLVHFREVQQFGNRHAQATGQPMPLLL